MRTILSLFSRSPFSPFLTHMEKVGDCVETVVQMCAALQEHDYQRIAELATKASELEHSADAAKQNIRNQLAKSVFLPVDRKVLLEALSTQDSIADKAENIGVVLTLRELKLHPHFKKEFIAFLDKNIETFHEAQKVILELGKLLESSFGGMEAEKVKQMVCQVAYLEHEADLIQRQLLKKFYNPIEELSTPEFNLWLQLFEQLSEISNLSERLALKVRTMLDISR
ncbi:MAG: TIGR00153 family protein [Chlamydiota bacterium]